jgi:prepilin-type processing-associated H-X9-DG protein
LNRFGEGDRDCSTYNGTSFKCSTRAAGVNYPLATTVEEDTWRFGSYHPGICQFTFCDGHVRPIPVTIDPYILGLLAARNDGQPIPSFDD